MTAPPADPRGGRSRALAAQVLDRVTAHGTTLEAALAEVRAEAMAGADKDRARVQALAFGALRWHPRLAFLSRRLLDRPLKSRDRILESLIIVGLFELLDGTQPPWAVVSAAVEACRLLGRPSAAGLVNAVLRRCQRESAALLAAADQNEEARHAHPAWLIRVIRAAWPHHWEAVLAANQAPPPLWLRVNRRRTDPGSAASRITADTGIPVHRNPAFPDGLRLETPLPVERIPGFAEGEVSVQDAASQVVVELLLHGLEPETPSGGKPRALDACAAPGGKLCHLLERGADDPPGAGLEVTALDVDGHRLGRVRENLARLGLEARVLAGDAGDPRTWWDGRPFHRILLDAPCSGTGVIRRHPDIKLLRRPGTLPALAARQGTLLDALWTLLAPGGRLVYTTCSILPEENGAVVAAFLARHPEARLIAEPAAAGFPAALVAALAGSGPGWQLLPGTATTDGFYYAVMDRPG